MHNSASLEDSSMKTALRIPFFAAFVNVVVASLFPNRLRTYRHFQGGVLEYHLTSDHSF
jgi:hypothetical protein